MIEPIQEAFPHDLFQSQADYVELRRALVMFFQSNGSTEYYDHADETIMRVYKNHSAGIDIKNLRAYTYGIARNVLHEYRRQSARRLEECLRSDGPDEVRFGCLEECLRRALSPDDRKVIRAYYSGHKRRLIEKRAKLASVLKVPPEALRMRVKRIRERLEPCVKDCEERQQT